MAGSPEEAAAGTRAGNDAFARFMASSAGALVAESITLPTDVAKVRLQVQAARPDGTLHYTGMVDCLRKTSAHEGIPALWKGLAPALLRQVSYTSLSMLLYEPIRDALASPEERASHTPFWKRLLAGGAAGGISIFVFNPTEVLKTQIQTARGQLSMAGVAKAVAKQDGVAGFWAGVQPNVVRTFLVQAAELGVYDQAKTTAMPYVGGDNFWAHLSGSGAAGLASAVTSTPADVVKTRLMNNAGGAQAYSGMIDAFTTILRVEGAAALYKGFVPIFCRKIVWVTTFFLSYERIRPLLQS